MAASDDRDLGLDGTITRKDFLNAALLGVGGVLLSSAAPALSAAAALEQSRLAHHERRNDG